MTDNPVYYEDWDAYEHFGTIPRTMFTLFETSIEPLNLRPVIEKQPGLFPFFFVFIFLTNWGVMNVIIGVTDPGKNYCNQIRYLCHTSD